MVELVRPTADLRASWWEMVDEFAGERVHGAAIEPGELARIREPAAFEAWVDWLWQSETPGPHLPGDRVPASTRWIVEDGRLVGTISLRHELTDFLLQAGGHIGYAVRPRARRRGVATAALRLALAEAARRGIDPVLVTCESDNVASARTIEACGGLLEDVRGGMRRYWLQTGAAVAPISLAPVEARTARLVLFTDTDVDAMLSGRRLPSWAPGYPREDDVEAARMLRGPDVWSPRHVVRRSDALVVGSIGCFGPPDDRGVVEIGYGLVPEARGSGLMTDVVPAMAAALAAAGCTVIAHTDPGNTASWRVLRRCGFRLVGSDGGEQRWERGASPTTVAGP
ncbi:MAG TPA: GNAT family N-acetyltransferase [Intrasporangium sp.]|uniref:GNAT family N-acetyltransferase n=1 Tax=Intrasporangium sp. TaxID=1925024 RepID=UPI002D769BBE|nr:GNAT family N-acetyltransferase [Intrasporangium sp.]HET7400077.1 GNAT family N-acetyltransferase [Intrasporangium sp.]